MKILMVCLGNICRSPMAEGIMKRKIAEHKLDWVVDSAGTGSWHIGENPDNRAQATTKKYGIDISPLRARQFRQNDFKNFDHIFVMDASNYREVISQASNEKEKEKVQLIMNTVDEGMNASVPDPYWNDDGFDQVFHMLDQACDRIIEKGIGSKSAE